MNKQIVIIGLGKMGKGLALQLREKGWEVFGYNRTESVTRELENEGIKGIYSFSELREKLTPPRLTWVMVPAGKPIEETLSNLTKVLEKGDIVVDGGNSFYEETKRRGNEITDLGFHFLDVGVSGGPGGARNGACMMVGGEKEMYEQVEDVFRDTCVASGYGYFGVSGAGHFVKMVHNGIEYGMMQAIAEGFDIMNRSEFKPDLKELSRVYNHGSVIESTLIEWIQSGFEEFGLDLEKVSGSAGSGGAAGMKNSEGQWTVDVAKKQGAPVAVIEESVNARIKSQESPSYQGKIINTLRNQFGGHSVEDS